MRPRPRAISAFTLLILDAISRSRRRRQTRTQHSFFPYLRSCGRHAAAVRSPTTGRRKFQDLSEVWIGGGGGSRTRVRKCYWSRDYMLIHVHAPGITLGRSRPPLRTDKKQLPLA